MSDIPMIPKHQAEKQMMHMSWTIRWLIIAIVVGFVCMLFMAYVFVTGYTARTKDWLVTYQTIRNAPITEVVDEKSKAISFQQLQVP